MTVQNVSALIKSASVRRAVINAVGRMRLVKAAQAVQPAQPAPAAQQPRMTRQQYEQAKGMIARYGSSADPTTQAKLKRLREHMANYEQAAQTKADPRLNFGNMYGRGNAPTAAQMQKDPNLKARYDATVKSDQALRQRYGANGPTMYEPGTAAQQTAQSYKQRREALWNRYTQNGETDYAGLVRDPEWKRLEQVKAPGVSTQNTAESLHNVTAQGMVNNASGGMQVDSQMVTGGRYLPGVLGPDGKPVWVDGGTVVQRVSPNRDSRASTRSAARANANSVGSWNRMSPAAKAKARNPWGATAQSRPYGVQTAPSGVQRGTGVDFGGGTGSGVSIGLSR